MSKDMSKKENSEMTYSEERPDYLGTETRGQENVKVEDITIPRLDVIQALSPQIQKNNPKHIEGAEVGMLFNSVTNELFPNGVNFIPAHYIKEWIIWKKVDAGGGFNGAFATELDARREFDLKQFSDDEYEIVDTANHFGILVSLTGESTQDICISMSKSKMKVNRNFNTLVKLSGGDRFSRVYRVISVEDTNKMNQTFYNLKISAKGYAPKALYERGEEMWQALSTAPKPVAHSSSNQTTDNEPDF